MSKNKTVQNEPDNQTLTVEELLAELTLLTNTEVIPPNQLLSIIAKSHVALTAQFVQFQAQQAEENHGTREAIAALSNKVGESIEPSTLTRTLVKHNRAAVIIRGIAFPILFIIAISLTHAQDIDHLWTDFSEMNSSPFILIFIFAILLLVPGYILTKNKK